jgi:hypothetical protein
MSHDGDGRAEARPQIVLPDGYADADAFLEAARERFQQGLDADRENREQALDDLRFLAGEQWDEGVRRDRMKARRPVLTINRLPAFVAQVVGDLRINRPGIRVRPAEDGDAAVAEVRQGLIRAIEHQSKAQGVYAAAGQAQAACGLGCFRVGLEYAGEDAFDRDIRISAIRNPFAVVWDPLATEPTGADASWCFVQEEMDRKTFEAAYGSVADDDMGHELSEAVERQGWMTRDTVRVCEYWMMKERPAVLHLLPDGRTVEEPPVGVTPLKSRRTVRRSAVMYLITGHRVLEGPFEYPIPRLPVFRAVGWEIPVGERTVRFGLVRWAKDAQRLMNVWRSTAAELVAGSARNRWLASEESVEGREEAFRNAHASGDPLLLYRGPVPPQLQPAPQVPAALLNEAALAAQDMKDCTGLHDASLGARSNETSGRAILARDRQGDVATYIYPDNLKAAIEECGRVVNALIPVVYDTARTVRVLGDDDAARLVRINDPAAPGSVDLARGKYDVVVESGPSYSTKRVEAAESMMAFVQAVPGAAAVAGDLIAKAQDWPMADQIGERLKRMLPPQVLAPPQDSGANGPADPRRLQAEAAAQAQAQALRQRAVALELEERAAKARRAVAEARLAEAHAVRAETAARAEIG